MVRKKIGLLLLGGNEWVGGLYYVLNIIKSLDYLPDSEKPEVYVFYGNEIAKNHLDELKYNNLIKINYNKSFLIKVLNKICQYVFRYDFKTKYYIKKYQLLGIYPYNYNCKVNIDNEKVIAWFPDFQHKFLPKLFSQNEINSRDNYLNSIQSKIQYLVFSSHTAKEHYYRFYQKSRIKTFVLQFNSIIDDDLPNFETIKDKYRLNFKYFIVSNQFWKHKNHLLILKSIKYLVENKSFEFKIVFTGREVDDRDPNYFNTLKEYVAAHNLSKHLVFLGFIPRNDQLTIMKNAMAVIQPSLFEGWGTVVEDAKTLNKQVIASSTPIHKEQLEINAYYFNENNFRELADLMLDYSTGKLDDKHNYKNIESRAAIFAKKLLTIFVD